MIDFTHFIEWAFYGLISVVSLYIANSIKEMKTSIECLNVTLATESQKLNNFKDTCDRHEATLERHSERLMDLEKNLAKCRQITT